MFGLQVDPSEVILCREAVSARVLKETDKENTSVKSTRSAGTQYTIGDHVFLAPGAGKANGVKSPRKRIRQRSKGSASSSSMMGRRAKIKTPLEHIFVDEIADVTWI